MSGKRITKEAIKRKTIADMKKLGIFKPEYTPLVDIFAELNEQYERITKEYKDSGYKFQEETLQGGAKKSPIVATLEVLRKDILAYSDRLCLNPKSLETVTIEKKGNSRLASVLEKLE
jgi:phage terminase small subunit